MKPILPYFQYLLPHHFLSRFIGQLAESRNPFIKSIFIRSIMRRYPVDLSEAQESNIAHFASFNDFFIRRLKPGIRPIETDSNVVTSPVDGYIAEMGSIAKDRLLQAKGCYFTLSDLLGDKKPGDPSPVKQLAPIFEMGSFMTLYLAPHQYHRFHAPYDGHLVAKRFIPGRLFSVNFNTAKTIPRLYSRNERLICLFEHERLGSIAMILVGAMIVGSIQLVFQDEPVRKNHAADTMFEKPWPFQKGDEVGHFKMGSTAILLFEKNKIEWRAGLHTGNLVKLGMALADIVPT